MDGVKTEPDLNSAWVKLESLLDEQLDADVAGSQQPPELLQAIGGLVPDWSEKERLFDDGAYSAVPDLFEVTAGLPADVTQGARMANYRVLKPLGSGGMGDVYLAERADGQYEKKVALKILSMGFGAGALEERFRREVQILAQLRHPNIASLLDAGVAEDGRPWFVLDYIDGVPLHRYCQQHALGSRVCIPLFIQVCEAVAYAHAQGIIHRDLKPENILVEQLDTGPHAVVLDFGVAARQTTSELTRTGLVLGTPAYMSPEQAMGESLSLDQTSDLFSLGIILYELMLGQRPFIGKNDAEISYHIIHETPKAPHRSALDADLTAILFKCLEKKPSERYSSVRALIEDLQRFLAGEPVSARPWGLGRRVGAKIARYPKVSGLLAVSTLIIMVSLGLVLNQYKNQQAYAAQQAQLAQQYGQTAQRIESNVRLIYSRPLHDIEKELEGLQQEYFALQQGLAGLDDAVLPSAWAALGQAALSLGLERDARQYLEKAWQAGKRSPDDALRLGQSYLRLYAKAVQRAGLLSSSEIRRLAIEQAREGYLAPARQYLEIGVGANEEESHISWALLHFADGKPEQAIELLKQVISSSSWPPRAMLEVASIYLDLGERYLISGDNQQALAQLQASDEMFEQAQQTARSYPEAYLGQCVSQGLSILIQDYQAGTTVLDACESVLQLSPNLLDAAIQAAQSYANLARQRLLHGEAPGEVLDRANALVLQIQQQDEKQPQAQKLLGTINLIRANWIYESGGDGFGELSQALMAFERAADYAPGDLNMQAELVQGLQRIGRVEYSNGRDGDSAFNIANGIQKELSQRPDALLKDQVAYANGLSWQGYYLYHSGRFADAMLSQAVEQARTTLQRAPNNPQAIRALALATWTLAEYLRLGDQDPSALSNEAVDLYQQVIEQDPSNHVACINQLGALALKIDFALDHGHAQQQQLSDYWRKFNALQSHLDNRFEARLLEADYWRYRAKQDLLIGEDPGSNLSVARQHLNEALDSPIDKFEAVQSHADLALFEHGWRADVKLWDQHLFAMDYQVLSDAITQFPDLPILRAQRGALALLTDTISVGDAVQDLESALNANPLLRPRFHQYLLRAKAKLTESG